MEDGVASHRRHIACGICRRRKLKCDGRRPQCSTCQRLGKDCEYTDVVRKAGPKRGYVRSLETRIAQLEKMISDYNIEDRDTGPEDAQLLDLDLDESMPPAPLVLELTRHFFNTFNILIPVIDRKRYMLQLGLEPNQQPRPFLQYAVMAMAAADGAQFRTLKGVMYERARKYLAKADNFDSGGPSISYIQALGIMATLEVRDGLFPQAWLNVGKAARACTMLSLHVIDADDWDGDTEETPDLAECRRTFWFIFYCDRAGSTATSLPALFKINSVFTKMPLNDDAYLNGTFGSPCYSLQDLLDHPATFRRYPNALFALTVALTETCYPITDHGKITNLHDSMDSDKWLVHYEKLEKGLLELMAVLPEIPPFPEQHASISPGELLVRKYRRVAVSNLHLWKAAAMLLTCRAGMYALQAYPLLMGRLDLSKLLHRALITVMEVLVNTRNPHDVTSIGAYPLHPIILFTLALFILAFTSYKVLELDSFRQPLEYISSTLDEIGACQPVSLQFSLFLRRVSPGLGGLGSNSLNEQQRASEFEHTLESRGVTISLPNFFDRWLDSTGEERSVNDSEDPKMVQRLVESFDKSPSDVGVSPMSDGMSPMSDGLNPVHEGRKRRSTSSSGRPVSLKVGSSVVSMVSEFSSAMNQTSQRAQPPRMQTNIQVNTNGHTNDIPARPRYGEPRTKTGVDYLHAQNSEDFSIRMPQPLYTSGAHHGNPQAPAGSSFFVSPHQGFTSMAENGGMFEPPSNIFASPSLEDDPPMMIPDNTTTEFDPPMYLPHQDLPGEVSSQDPWFERQVLESEMLLNQTGW